MALKMIIAEDEQSFREGLINLIDWKLYDIELTGVAENGRQALDLIKRDSPDLLLTDIRMPFLNGLELIRSAKAGGAQFHTILITGYDEFEYAKEAISLGVSDYLLKPCMPHDIVRVIMDVKQKLDHSDVAVPLNRELNRTWNRNIHLLKNQILTQWVRQPLMPLENRSLVIREVNLAVQPGPIEIGIVRMDMNDRSEPYPSTRDLELIRYAMQNIVNETLNDFYSGNIEVFRHDEDLLWLGNTSIGKSELSTVEIMKTVQHNLISYLKLSFSIALSSPHPSVNDAQLAYEEAVEAMEGRFYQGKGGIFLHEELNQQQSPSSSILDDPFLQRWEKELFTYLQNGQYEQAVDAIETGLRYFKERPGYTRSEVILLITSLILTLRKFAEEQYSVSIEWMDENIDWIEKMPEMESLDECSSILQKIVQCVVLAAPSRKTLHRTVHATLELIKSKYNSNLTLEQAAKETFVSNSYLSSLFKQELGVNFLDYLHQYRIEQAKELLRKNYKIYAVAKLVGYQEERHFSSTFKKWTGLAPRQYQKGYEAIIRDDITTLMEVEQDEHS
ncbi:MAG: response regulator [Candidatus Cohnella colombiensis]|uniref:Response regulator n=1 Tax=Candidatus Cohnella colombiensis TaxID=3121368 RepID=A0AA95JB03_9BACL|nr:MAG: response regulator [Cohnella sp.]